MCWRRRRQVHWGGGGGRALLGCARQGFAGAGSSHVAIFDGGCSLLGLGSASQGGLALLVEKLGGGGGVVRLLLGLAGRDLISGNVPRLGGGRGSGRHDARHGRAGARVLHGRGRRAGVCSGREDLNLGG